jgi:hypothetical protein
MRCIGNSPLTALLTNDIKQRIQDAKTTYESQCAAGGSPITLDIGSAFSAASSASTAAASTTLARASTSISIPTATLSSTGSVSTAVSSTGAGYVHAPSFAIAAAAAMAVFAAV